MLQWLVRRTKFLIERWLSTVSKAEQYQTTADVYVVDRSYNLVTNGNDVRLR